VYGLAEIGVVVRDFLAYMYVTNGNGKLMAISGVGSIRVIRKTVIVCGQDVPLQG
jgi:hypothetical protein